MKKFIAFAVSLLIFVSVFSGCKFNISDLIKITPITTLTETTTLAQNEPATTADTAQTSVQETQPLSSNSTGNSSSASQTTKPVQTTTKPAQTTVKQFIHPEGTYTSKEDVSLYIHIYGKLPNNFITKAQAEALGWSGGGLEAYAHNKCIGGDYFGNYEGLLPKAGGRKYYECDIDTLRATSRGAKRIVYSNDGLIYYTADHYAFFTQLY